MKKTIVFALLALLLLSFVSCNLDNNGILINALEKVPSDNKNRSCIGFDGDKTMYYVTVDGLVKRTVESSDKGVINTPEIVISNHSIFTHYYQALGWLQDDNTIVYMTDSAGNNGGQAFYSIDTSSADEVTSLKVEGKGTGIVDCYKASDEARLVGDDGTIYSAKISGETLTLTVTSESKGTFVSSTNGLIRYSDGSYYYEGKKTSGISGVVRSFATSDDGKKYAVSVSGSSFVIYKADGGTEFSEIKSISGSNNNEFPSLIDSAGNLYFLYYRGTRSSSIVYKVSPSGEVSDHDLQKNNIRAEAFVQGSDNKIYMLSKDNNMFVVTI